MAVPRALVLSDTRTWWLGNWLASELALIMIYSTAAEVLVRHADQGHNQGLCMLWIDHRVLRPDHL